MNGGNEEIGDIAARPKEVVGGRWEEANDLDNGLKKLSSDQDVLQMLKYVEKYKVIDLYVDHSVTKETVNVDESFLVNELDNDLFIGNQELGNNDKDVIEDVSKDEWLQNCLRNVGIKKKHAIENDNVRGQSYRNESMNVDDDIIDGSNSDDGSTSDDDSDSQDSDFLVDPDNMIDDVDVDMAEFRSNIDANVKWVGSKAIVTMEEEEFEEERVNHDELDSGSDSEYEGERKKALKMYHKMKKANASNADSGGTTWKENFYVGLKFLNSKEIKEIVTRVAVEQRRELHLKKNGKVRVRCIYRGKVPQFGCEDGDDDSGSKGVVSSGSKGKGQAKKMAQERVKGNHTRQYAQLRDYCLELKNSNPNTTIKIEVEPPEDINSIERKFKRVYVCLGPLKDGFKAGKKDLLGLDGCFLSVDLMLDDNMITYDEYQNDSGAETVPTVLQGRDDSIRNLQAQNDIMSLLNVGSTDDSCNKQALETELTQLKDIVTSLKIQNDGEIAAQKAKIATLNAKTVGNKTSGTTKPANPKVIAPGMYVISPKYIVPQRRTNRETLILLPKKKQVTFQETPKPSPRFTKKPVAPLLKKPNVNVPLSIGIKSATEASKLASKSNAWIYRKLPAKSAKGEKVEEHIRNLNKNNHVNSYVKRSVSIKNLNAVCGACHECLISSNHDNCLVYSVKSMNRKQPKAKNNVRTTKNVWRPKVVTSIKPMWKPTGRHFTLYDSYPLTRILEPTVERIELSPSVSSSTEIPMLSKFVVVTLGKESWFQRNPCYV
nr:hypothetical protein [Tanacetum cinerariifolium]